VENFHILINGPAYLYYLPLNRREDMIACFDFLRLSYNVAMLGNALTFSRETGNLKRSVMRDLLRLAVDPDIISLAGGLPANDALPTKDLAECFQTVLQQDGPKALQYSPQLESLKSWISSYMEAQGVSCSSDQVFITNGAQQGLSILSRLFLDPGQPAVIEAVTFTGIHQITIGRSAEVRCVPTDLSTGVDVDALEKAFQSEPRPRLAVLITHFHNPLGVSISPDKRQRIADLATEYGVPLIEDDPYLPLRFEGQAAPPIKAYDHSGQVFYLGSFSKMLAPAMRLGWIVAPADLIPRIMVVRESIDLESSTLIQRSVAEYLRRDLLPAHLEQLAALNRRRCQAMLAALQDQMSDFAHWTRPQGGLFVWLTLPEQVDTWEMFKEAVQHKVAYIPGSAFAVEGGHDNTIRLNFSNVTQERIEEGIGRLAAAIRSRI
jgi:2-aminoadipate transaminase